MGARTGRPADQGGLAFVGSRIAVRLAYEWHDDAGQWFRRHGKEQWEFGAAGPMRRREAGINAVPIDAAARLLHWPLGPRPEGRPGLTELGLRGRCVS